MNWNAIAAVLLVLAVILGAFGAHGLRDRLDAYSMSLWEKAVFYHFIHAMGVLIVSILPRTQTFPAPAASNDCWLLAAGIRVLVGIAAVDALVERATPIDTHAARETTSVYTGVRTFPMLPERLSTDLTSLNEGEVRAAIVIEMVVEPDGTIASSRVF